MIYRVKGHGTILDFGAKQAAFQMLDNYPPHVRESVSVNEITSAEIEESIAELSRKLVSCREGTTHYEWLMSRVEFYQDALPIVQQSEAAIRARVESLPKWDGESKVEVNEVYRS